MLSIKVLGTGCPNCIRLEKIVHQAADHLGIEAHIEKVTDMSKIMEYPIMTTPGLVIGEKVVCSGRVPSPAEVTTWLTSALV